VSGPLWDHYLMRGPRSETTFAGRDAELDLLCGALGALEATGARTILVGGEAGIGKTRLIEEFRLRARAAGSLVASGVCTPTEGGGLPYGPVVGVVRDLSRQLDEATAAAILARARRRLGLDDDPSGISAGLANEMGKTHLFEALLSCFAALAERSPVVIVFEDLHWADSASVEVIDFLARNLDTSPLLLVGTFRRDDLEQDQTQARLLAELGRHRAVSQLELTGLDVDATGILMHGMLGREPEWALLEAVYARSGGNPFFAEELTAARDATSLPSALRQIIMMRVEQLGPASRHVAAVVATAGGSIGPRLLAETAGLDAERLNEAITEAVERHVLVMDDRSRFRFRHALQCDAVVDALLPDERARLHHQLAVALTANPALRATGPGHAAVELAEHWWEAGDWSEALPASTAAADAMVELLAMREAYAHYERAVSAYAQVPREDAVRCVNYVDLLLKAANAAYLTGAPKRSIELANLALAELDDVNDPRRAALCFIALGRNAWSNLDPDGAFEAFQRAAELLPSDTPSVELAAVVAEEARSLMLLARSAESEIRCLEAITIARAAGARAEEGHALCTLGVCIAERGDYDTAVARMREALEIAEELGEPYHLNRVYTNLTAVLVSAGRLEDAATIVFQGVAQGERLVGIRLNGAGRNSAEALIRLGRWDEADDLLSHMDDHGVGSCPSRPLDVRALLDIRRGRFESAASYLMADDALSQQPPTVQDLGALHMARAELALEKDQPADAYEEIEQALMIAAGTDDNTYRPEMCALGIRALADEHAIARARGRRIDTDKFRRLAAALTEQAVARITPIPPDGTEGSARPLALLAWCRAEQTRFNAPDPDAWKTAATRWDEALERYHAAYCRWREAEATLAGKGERRRATDAARAAWQTSVEIGARPLQTRCEDLARRARIALTPTETATAPSPRQLIGEDLGLTPREIEVLAQLALGRTDRQIAEELYISKKTASVHVSNILRKLDAANRIDAAEIAQRVGLS